ncbi:MAG: histone deacetylase [Desulfobacteraceae bacterium]|jgi:acetoin utilization deacetylase AcuC-like enzyme
MKVAVVRDEKFLAHKTGHTHPENPARLKAVYRMLDREFAKAVIYLKPRMATLEELELVHTPVYINKVLKTAEHDFTSLATHTPVSAQTYLSAWLAVGSCLSGIEALMSGRCEICLCLVRPPGHHALPDRAGGFCIFNNLAICARYAIRQHGVQRVLIIDWDVHHGNGIQDIFYNEKAVFYFSTHDKLLYPYTGDFSETGSGEGDGYTLNIPLPRQTDDDDLLYVYRAVLCPLLSAYRPELILVSAGFDAHRQDPMGRLSLSAAAFGRLTKLVANLAKNEHAPPILFSLEGGYDPGALTECMRKVLKALTAECRAADNAPATTLLGEQLVARARQIHAAFSVWA